MVVSASSVWFLRVELGGRVWIAVRSGWHDGRIMVLLMLLVVQCLPYLYTGVSYFAVNLF